MLGFVTCSLGDDGRGSETGLEGASLEGDIGLGRGEGDLRGVLGGAGGGLGAVGGVVDVSRGGGGRHGDLVLSGGVDDGVGDYGTSSGGAVGEEVVVADETESLEPVADEDDLADILLDIEVGGATVALGEVDDVAGESGEDVGGFGHRGECDDAAVGEVDASGELGVVLDGVVAAEAFGLEVGEAHVVGHEDGEAETAVFLRDVTDEEFDLVETVGSGEFTDTLNDVGGVLLVLDSVEELEVETVEALVGFASGAYDRGGVLSLIDHLQFFVLVDGVDNLLDDVLGDGPVLEVAGVVAAQEAEPRLLDALREDFDVDLAGTELDLIGVEIHIALRGEVFLIGLEEGADDGVSTAPDGVVGLDVVDTGEFEGDGDLHESTEEAVVALGAFLIEGTKFLNDLVDSESVCHDG